MTAFDEAVEEIRHERLVTSCAVRILQAANSTSKTEDQILEEIRTKMIEIVHSSNESNEISSRQR